MWAFRGLWGHLEALGAQKADGNDGICGMRGVPGLRRELDRVRSDSFSHALLTQRVAAERGTFLSDVQSHVCVRWMR